VEDEKDAGAAAAVASGSKKGVVSSPSPSAVSTVAADAELGGGAAAAASTTNTKRVSFPEDGKRDGETVNGGKGGKGGKTTTATPPPPQRRRSVFLQRPAELKGFWPKLAEVAICALRQLLLIFPVSRREFLDMREAWLAAHKLFPASPPPSSSSELDNRSVGSGTTSGDIVAVEEKNINGSPFLVSSTLPPISFADYVMKSFDDDVAGIVGLVRSLVVSGRGRKNGG